MSALKSHTSVKKNGQSVLKVLKVLIMQKYGPVSVNFLYINGSILTHYCVNNI